MKSGSVQSPTAHCTPSDSALQVKTQTPVNELLAKGIIAGVTDDLSGQTRSTGQFRFATTIKCDCCSAWDRMKDHPSSPNAFLLSFVTVQNALGTRTEAKRRTLWAGVRQSGGIAPCECSTAARILRSPADNCESFSIALMKSLGTNSAFEQCGETFSVKSGFPGALLLAWRELPWPVCSLDIRTIAVPWQTHGRNRSSRPR